MFLTRFWRLSYCHGRDQTSTYAVQIIMICITTKSYIMELWIFSLHFTSQWPNEYMSSIKHQLAGYTSACYVAIGFIHSPPNSTLHVRSSNLALLMEQNWPAFGFSLVPPVSDSFRQYHLITIDWSSPILPWQCWRPLALIEYTEQFNFLLAIQFLCGYGAEKTKLHSYEVRDH